MNAASGVLKQMLEGFETYDQRRRSEPSRLQKLKVNTAVSGLQLKGLIGQRGRSAAVARKPTIGLTQRQLRVRGQARRPNDSGSYRLTTEEVRQFETRGILGPYNLFSPKEAEEFGAYIYDLYDRNFDDKVLIGKRAEKVLRKRGAWAINYAGLFQAIRYQRIWDTLIRREIAERVATLLGDDVICWRSQLFEKRPGDQGTFWHQASTFREISAKPKLLPPPGVDDAIAQVTVWLALSDATIETGCLRFLPGSFVDGRFEDALTHFREDLPGYLAKKDRDEARRIMGTFLLSPDLFEKARLVFDLVIEQIPDLFDSYAVEDIEVKAGDFLIFTSSNTHASFPNVSRDAVRFSLAGRYTANDVRVFGDMRYDVVPTPEGPVRYPLDDIGCIQVHGSDRTGLNRIVPYQW